MIVEEITTTEGLEAIRDDWHRLWQLMPGSTPFQTPDWLIPWWRHLGEGELLTIAIRDAGRLIGLLPLYVYRRSIDAPRQLFPLGIGTSDYLNVLLAPEADREALQIACAHLDRLRDNWDQWEFPQIRAGSPLLSVKLPRGWVSDLHTSMPCPVLNVPANAELGTLLPSAMRRNLRADWRRAQETGPVQIEEVNEEALEQNFAALLRLHRLRWSSRGEEDEAGVLSREVVIRANRESARAFLRRGMLRLPVLRIGERVIAAIYGFVDSRFGRHSFYYYLGGFDASFARISPGSLLIGHAVEQIAAAGGGVMDFLRGAESYKYRWGAVDFPTHARRFRHT